MPVRIEAPDGSIVEFPDGTPDDVIENAMRQEYGGGGQSGTPSPQAVQGNPDAWGMDDQAMDTLTFGGMSKLNAAGAGALDAAAGWMQGNGWDWSGAYDRNLERMRADKEAYSKEHPLRAGVGTGAGVMLGLAYAPTMGSGLTGAAGTGAAYGAGAGALQDADTWTDRLWNTYGGARTGAGIGVLGYGAGKGLQWLGDRASKAYRGWAYGPEKLAEQKVYETAEKVGLPKVQKRMTDLGPDAVVADAMGARGTSMARRASNLDPEAREIISDTLLGRKSQQNLRVMNDMDKIAGIQPGAEKTVQQLVDAVDDQFRPELNRLYTQARQAGKDIPMQYFDDVLQTKYGQSVYNEAVEAVQSRARLNGTPDDISNLAIVDEMKKIFDSKATAAFASADKATGGLYADFAKNLRLRADALFDQMDDPIYQEARNLAQQAHRAKEAIRTGEGLGAGRVPIDLPGKAQDVDLGNRQRMAQGYVAKKADTLMNRGSTDGALNELSTPQGRRAADAALGPGNLDQTVNRERTFNATTRQLMGNSSTAQQLMDDGGMSMWPRILTSPAGAARDFMGYLATKVSTEKQRAMAPVVAKLLMSNSLPGSAPIPPTLVQKMLNAADENAAKALLLTWERDGTKMTPRQREQISNTLEGR